MSKAVACQPTLVVLSAEVWRSELEAELTRLGHKDPRAAATKILQRILARAAGWPREAFAVAEQLQLLDADR